MASFLCGMFFGLVWYLLLHWAAAPAKRDVIIVKGWRKPTDDKVEMSADRLRRFTGHG